MLTAFLVSTIKSRLQISLIPEQPHSKLVNKIDWQRADEIIRFKCGELMT